jgi:hypothetical protein
MNVVKVIFNVVVSRVEHVVKTVALSCAYVLKQHFAWD